MGGFNELKKHFDDAGIKTGSLASLSEDDARAVFQTLVLQILFEINGNLDSIAIALRQLAKTPTR